MRLGISLFISGLFLIAIGFMAQQMGFGPGMLSSRLGQIEIVLSCWPGFLVFWVGLTIGGIVRIVVKKKT